MGIPSVTIALARTVAQVVPSPALSFVLLATSWTSLAPIFCNLSGSSTAFATETPSFVMCGDPHDFSMITVEPFGPIVVERHRRVCLHLPTFRYEHLGQRQHPWLPEFGIWSIFRHRETYSLLDNRNRTQKWDESPC